MKLYIGCPFGQIKVLVFNCTIMHPHGYSTGQSIFGSVYVDFDYTENMIDSL